MFKNILKMFNKKQYHKEPRMYVIIRGDLHPTYAMVQGSHALIEFALDYPEKFKRWKNEYLIFLKVWNLNALVDFGCELAKNKYDFSYFKEPDLQGQITAIAIYDNGKAVDGLPLA